MNKNAFQEERLKFKPTLPPFLENLEKISSVKESSKKPNSEIQALFPHIADNPFINFSVGSKLSSRPLKVGIVLSGGQASGGHNVIGGLFDAIQKLDSKSVLIGFLNGPSGIIEDKTIVVTGKLLENYRNTGGFDLLGSGRTKIDTEEKLEKALKTVQKHSLDGLCIVGGDDSNTNAAILAEYFKKHGSETKVIGVPKTIDGDLKNTFVEVSFGFDTACKTYSEIIGNIARDAISSKKYTHFIKLMGRTASHITLECALQVHPTLALIGEEIAKEKKTLSDVVKEIGDVIIARSKIGKEYGVVLIPEGLIEFIPEFKELIRELNNLLAKMPPEEVQKHLSASSKQVFDSLPEKIQKQLLLDRDPHGNVQVSHIATEELFIEMVKSYLSDVSFKGKFHPVSHFLGYEGRSGFPSNFDATYCYSLGFVAALLICEGHSGYMATLCHLSRPVVDWKGCGVPLTSMMHLEERKGKKVPVIQKALVDLERDPFTLFQNSRKKWQLEDHFRYPGPIQYFGPVHLTDRTTFTLELERG